jgi:uncharacterized protein YerC
MSIYERFKQHCKPSAHKKHKYKLYKAMAKYGTSNFYVELLEDNIEYKNLDKKEIYWIEQYDSYKNGYNSTPGGDGKVINKIQNIEEIVELLKSGVDVKDVAQKYNVHTATINRVLKANGYPNASAIKPKGLPHCKLRTLPREEIEQMYLSGKSYKYISETLHINPRSVSRVVKELGIGKENMIDYNNLDISAILKDFKLYFNGEMQKKDILKKYGLNQYSYKRIMKMVQNGEDQSNNLEQSKI